ncbi:MAG: hypothetical protein AB8B97_28270 [Granulosicoccus sp.]
MKTAQFPVTDMPCRVLNRLNAHSRRSKNYALPLALAGVALMLAGCGGSSSGGNSLAAPASMDDDQSPSTSPSDNPSDGDLVTDGQFAGLNQACVDLLLDIDPNASPESIQLNCRPENIEDDESDPVDVPPVSEPISVPMPLPIEEPPTVASGLNVAPADITGGSYYQNSRVSALLTGPLFGSGNRPNSELVKPLAVQVNEVAPGLRLVELRAVRDSFGGSNADFLGVVQNTGTDFLCSITIDEISEFSSTGQRLDGGDALDFALVAGEVGARTGDTFYFPSCLAPGNYGYMPSFRDVDYEDVTEVRSQSLRSSLSDTSQVDGAVLPVSYRLRSDGSITVTIVNNHTETLNVFSVDVFAIDAQGHAFAWDIALVVRDIAPGEEFETNGMFRRFEGTASTIRVVADFTLP